MTAFRERLRVVSAVGALVLGTGFLVVALLAVALNLRLLRDSFGWVEHTDDVLLQLAGIEADLVGAESAERGYLLTGHDQYRTNFDRAGAAVAHRFDALGELVADDPEQTRNVGELRKTADARLQQLKETIGIGPDHIGEALAAMYAAAPLRLTNVVRAKIAVLRGTEIGRRSQRQDKADIDTRRATILAVAATLLAFSSGMIGLVFFQRERARRRERELERELAHTTRLNMMGQTASMLAHELNQPLTATANYIAALAVSAGALPGPQSERLTQLVDRAAAQTQRAGEIVKRLRNFIEKAEPEKSIESIGVIFEEAIALLAMRGEGLTITTRADPDLPSVLVDRIQIQQVLINLMRNAIEAMQSSGRRSLELSARAEDSHMARISVRDSGSGLAKGVADNLFKPFVSTKTSGMGVGLSICRTIVEAHGGRIWAEPNLDGGTVFSFTVPTVPA